MSRNKTFKYDYFTTPWFPYIIFSRTASYKCEKARIPRLQEMRTDNGYRMAMCTLPAFYVGIQISSTQLSPTYLQTHSPFFEKTSTESKMTVLSDACMNCKNTGNSAKSWNSSVNTSYHYFGGRSSSPIAIKPSSTTVPDPTSAPHLPASTHTRILFL